MPGSAISWQRFWRGVVCVCLRCQRASAFDVLLLCCCCPFCRCNTVAAVAAVAAATLSLLLLLTSSPCQYESPLLRSLKALHNYLQAFDDLQDVDTVMYLRPFLDVIESQDTRWGSPTPLTTPAHGSTQCTPAPSPRARYPRWVRCPASLAGVSAARACHPAP